jgi:hypothetical protein
MRSLIILATLQNLRNARPTDELKCKPEPRHFYHGFGFTEKLLESVCTIVYYNALFSRKGPVQRISTVDWLRELVGCEGILAYSLKGCGQLLACKLLGLGKKRVLVLYSGPSKTGPLIKVVARKWIYALGVRSASDVICFSQSALDETKGLQNGRRVLYSPVTTDVEYFKLNGRVSKGVFGLKTGKFIAVVGDDTRDEEFVYSALREIKLPIVRITRDPKIAKVVESLMNPGRGDRLILRVSFEELRTLYFLAAACVFVSRYDSWQPAGATSIAECLASGGMVVAEGGGCIERDFSYLSQTAHEVLTFFKVRSQNELLTAVATCMSVADVDREKMRRRSAAFAEAYLNVEFSHDIFGSVLNGTSQRTPSI